MATTAPQTVPGSMDSYIGVAEETATPHHTLRPGGVGPDQSTQPHDLLSECLGEDVGSHSDGWGDGGTGGN